MLPDGGFKSQSVIGLENGNGQPEFLSGYEGQSPLHTPRWTCSLSVLAFGAIFYMNITSLILTVTVFYSFLKLHEITHATKEA